MAKQTILGAALFLIVVGIMSVTAVLQYKSVNRAHVHS
jgi:hypothetical protein